MRILARGVRKGRCAARFRIAYRLERRRSAEAFSSSNCSRFFTIGDASVSGSEQLEAVTSERGSDQLETLTM